MAYLAKKSIPSRGTRRATSGFQGIGVSRTCWTDIWSNRFPWSALGRQEKAKVTTIGPRRGLDFDSCAMGASSYFKDNQVRASYTAANGLR